MHGDIVTCRYLLYGATAWLHHFSVDSSPPYIVLEDVWVHGSCLLLMILPCPDEHLVSFAEHMSEGKVLPMLVGLYCLAVVLEQLLLNIFEDTLPLYRDRLVASMSSLWPPGGWLLPSSCSIHGAPSICMCNAD